MQKDVVIFAFETTDFDMTKVEDISEHIEDQLYHYNLLQVIVVNAEDFNTHIQSKMNEYLFQDLDKENLH